MLIWSHSSANPRGIDMSSSVDPRPNRLVLVLVQVRSSLYRYRRTGNQTQSAITLSLRYTLVTTVAVGEWKAYWHVALSPLSSSLLRFPP